MSRKRGQGSNDATARKRASNHYTMCYLTGYINRKTMAVIESVGLTATPGNISKVKTAITQVEKDGFIRGLLCRERSENEDV